MSKALLAVVAISAMAVPLSASGQEQPRQQATVSQPGVYTTPQARRVQRPQRRGFLSRLMDLERRKNAWLRDTFGRNRR